MINERKLTKSERKKREDIVMGMKKNKRDLVKRYGKDAEQVMYARAAKIAKNETKEKMKDLNITELIEDALKNPKKADLNKDGKLSDYEKKRGAAIEKAIEDKSIKEYDSLEDEAKRYYLYLFKIGKIDKLPDNPKEAFLIQMTKDQMEKDAKKDRFERGLKENANMGLADIEEMGYEAGEKAFEEIKNKFQNAPDHKAYRDGFFQGWIDQTQSYGLNEDLDLGHEDNEPHMLKADLYRIGKYAMELYQMVDQFEGRGEVDFPHWWQSKIIKAKDMLTSAKHYLDFELKEPQIDAMVDVATDTGAIDEANPDMADDDMFRFAVKRTGDNTVDVIDTKTDKVVKSGLGLLSAVKLKDKLNNYTRVDVKGEPPIPLDVDTDVDPGEPLGLAEKLVKQLKEYTEDNFSGQAIISSMPSLDMSEKQAFREFFPQGAATTKAAIEALRAHDASPIKARMGRFAPMFVHMQYHDFMDGAGEKYRVHQTQYYNSNFKDRDPNFNPRVTELALVKLADPENSSENIRMGKILVKTDDYIKDLKNLNIIKRVS